MASKKDEQPGKKGSLPSGVRGPGGPPAAGRPAAGRSGAVGTPSASTPGWRRSFEQRSYPLLQRLHHLPRWLVVVAPALLLFLGLVLTGPLAWVGGLLLLIVWLFIAWLTVLSWPALSPGSKAVRFLVVAALLGIVVLKFLGKF